MTSSNRITLPAIPVAMLEAAQQITLAELLSSPACSCWMISALNNILRFSKQFEGADEQQQVLLLMDLFQIMQGLSPEVRVEMFKATTAVVKESRIARGTL